MATERFSLGSTVFTQWDAEQFSRRYWNERIVSSSIDQADVRLGTLSAVDHDCHLRAHGNLVVARCRLDDDVRLIADFHAAPMKMTSGGVSFCKTYFSP